MSNKRYKLKRAFYIGKKRHEAGQEITEEVYTSLDKAYKKHIKIDTLINQPNVIDVESVEKPVVNEEEGKKEEAKKGSKLHPFGKKK